MKSQSTKSEDDTASMSWVVKHLGKIPELLLGIFGLLIGSILALAQFFSSNSPGVSTIAVLSCVSIISISMYTLIQTWVLAQSVKDAHKATEKLHKNIILFRDYRYTRHESDKIFRQIQEKRSNLDRYFLEISLYRSIRDTNAKREILSFLEDLCDFCNKILAIRNNLQPEFFQSNIKIILKDSNEYYYDTLVRCSNTTEERRNNKNSRWPVKTHAVFDKLQDDLRRRHIIRDLSNYLEHKRRHGRNGGYTGPSANALEYYGSSICVAIFDQNLDDQEYKNRENPHPFLVLDSSTSITTSNNDIIHGFFLVDTKKMIFDYESGDVDILRELAISAKSAIKLLKVIETGSITSR